MAEINEIINKEAISGIEQADKGIQSLDKNLMELVKTLIKANEELKKEGVSFKDVAAAQKLAEENAKKLKDEEEQLIKIEKKVTENTDKVVKAKIQAAQKTKAQKDRITELINVEKREVGSIDALRAANKKLTKIRNAASDATEKGRKKIELINKKLDQNNAKIKSNSDSLTKQKIGIGGYTDGITNALSQLGLMPPALTKVATANNIVTASTNTGTKAMKIFKFALASTGIGLLVIAVASLVQYFKRTEEGASKLQQILAPFKVLLGNLGDLAGDLGESIVGVFENPKAALNSFVSFLKDQVIVRVNSIIELFGLAGKIIKNVFSGDFEEAGDNLKLAGKAYLDALTGVEDTAGKIESVVESTKNIIEETKKESQILVQLEKDRLALQKATRGASIETKKQYAEIADLILLTRDADGDRVEQQQALVEAERIQREISQRNISIKAESLRIAQAEAELSDSDAETLDTIAQLESDLFTLRKEGADKVREIVNRQVELQNKINAEVTKEVNLRKKLADEASKVEFELEEEASVADITEDPIIQNATQRAIAILELAKKTTKESLAIEEIALSEVQSLYESRIIDFDQYEALKTEITERENEKRKELTLDAINAVNEAISLGVEIYNNGLEAKAQADELQRQQETERNTTQRDLDLAAAGENKDKKLAINESFKTRQAEIDSKFDRKQAEIKTKQAKADKTAALITAAINTAVAISSVSPVIPLMILAGALGALQIAAIASQPIPQFFKGTENAPDGLISLAEKGEELIKTKTGQLLMATKPTITSGLGGAKIYTNEQTEKILKGGAGYDSIDLRGVIESNNRVEKAIKNIPIQQTSSNNRNVTTTTGNYTETYLKRKIGV